MYTAYALVRNLSHADSKKNAENAKLQFRDFCLWNLPQCEVPYENRLNRARGVFAGATVSFGDWVYERNYSAPPRARGLYRSDLGCVAEDAEDDLLLLRLFKTGDISFARVAFCDVSGGLCPLYPYRVISDFRSPLIYRIAQNECPDFDAFSSELGRGAAWGSHWFMIARRYFLYGGAKEFNCEADRILDYMIALEAALVPERDFVGRRLRERAERLVCKGPAEFSATKELLRELYGVRSTIAHGSPLTDAQRDFLHVRRNDVEDVVRKVLVESLRKVPAEEDERKAHLGNLWDISDGDRAQKLYEDFCNIKDSGERSRLLDRLSRRPSP
jgi:hypothetical protein